MRMTTVFLVALLATRSSRSQEVLFTLPGDAQEDRFGFSVAAAGDVNGDGTNDVVVGAIWDDDAGLNSGSARVVSGLDGSTLRHFVGDAKNDQFGWSVAGAGDADADGFADVVVGAPFGSMERGYARILSGQDGTSVQTYVGAVGGDVVGFDVAGVGDIDQDGFDDVMIGSPDVWKARIFSSATGALIHEFSGLSNSGFGWSVAGVGDAIADGFPDVVVGAPEHGRATLRSGQDGALLHAFIGASGADRFGESVEGAGDLNDDGFRDVLVGAPKEDTGGLDAGSIHVYSGIVGTPIVASHGVAGDGFGAAAGGDGDVDGDGVIDIVVGAPGLVTTAGRVYIISTSGTSSITAVIDGGDAGDRFGSAVAFVADADGDGHADWMVGAPSADDHGDQSGSAVLFKAPCGMISPYGSACPGSGGVSPTLTLSGCAAAKGALTLRVEDGPGGAFALLLLGASPISVTGPSGCLLLVPATISLPVALSGAGPGAGTLTVTGSFSAIAPSGATFVVQAIIADSGVAHGYTTTGGVQVTLD